MKAVLTIELEVLEPAIVGSASQLQDLHPSQIRWVSIRLTADGEGLEEDSVTFEAQADDARLAIRNLVALAQKSQPEGTAVVVWYQGRSERFLI
jgi:hypothetical protein